MRIFRDIHNRQIRLTEERQEHIENDHPEMRGQIQKIRYTLLNPYIIIRSRTDENVELFYKFYQHTPVKAKYLCVVVKNLSYDLFVITAYFTDTIKRGEILWEKK